MAAWDTSEWLTLIIAFAGMIMLKFFLFNRGLQNKMKYYYEPYSLAQEVIEQKSKSQKDGKNRSVNPYDIQKMAQLVNYNLHAVCQEIKQDKKDIKKEFLSEKLKSATLYLAIVKTVYKEPASTLNENLNIMAQIVGPKLTELQQVKDLGQESEKSKKSKDYYLDKSLVLYVDFLVQELTSHLFGY